tara:strand:- start:137 stop:886 length:750 start_codon:yes stop_codon:yes gene_type:complete
MTSLITYKYQAVKILISRMFSTLAFLLLITTPALAEGVVIKNLGHSSLLIKGEGKSILLNPFKAVACAEGLTEPRLKVDYILANSLLADEGARIAEGIFFVQPGSYVVNDFHLEGLQVPHDRMGGRRFGYATLWTWEQGGLKFAHLGGSASSISLEDEQLLGRPDVLILAVGGGAKVYDGQEAALIVQQLKPKVVIPVQYLRGKAPRNCDQNGIQPFLDAMKDVAVKKVGNTFPIKTNIPAQTIIYLMD